MPRNQPSPRRRYDLAQRRAVKALDEMNDLARELKWPGIYNRLERVREAFRQLRRVKLPE